MERNTADVAKGKANQAVAKEGTQSGSSSGNSSGSGSSSRAKARLANGGKRDG
jgi:hypothetical protein